jgi:hypothetical protein
MSYMGMETLVERMQRAELPGAGGDAGAELHAGGAARTTVSGGGTGDACSSGPFRPRPTLLPVRLRDLLPRGRLLIDC